MDDDYRQRQRQIEAIERQNRELEWQNQLAAVQARIGMETYALQRNHFALQQEQSKRQIAIEGAQVEAAIGLVDATNNVAAATNHVANVIERGQRALLNVEMDKLQRRQKKDESKEFSHAQEHKIHALWARLPELNAPASPGAKFMLLQGMRDELVDIAIDAVHDIAFLDRDDEIKKKIGSGFAAIVKENPELAFIAADYAEKNAFAKRLQEQASFRTFDEVIWAQRFLMLQGRFPELNVPSGSTFPAKAHVFAQDVARLKNLCALLNVSGTEKDEPALMAIVMTGFPNLDPAVYAEGGWAALPVTPLTSQEAEYYYHFYRDRLALDAQTPTEALQRVLKPLAGFLKNDALPVAELRRREEEKRGEVAKIDAEIASIFEAKRKAEEEKEQERQRREREAKEAEARARREAELARQEQERRRQELVRMKHDLIDALFELLTNCPGIEPCIQFKKEIMLDDTLLARSHDGHILFFGNRVQWLGGGGDDYSIFVFAWRYAVELYLHNPSPTKENESLSDDELFLITNEKTVRFLQLFARAKDILPQSEGKIDHAEIQLRHNLVRRKHVALTVLALAMLSTLYGVLSGHVVFIVVSLFALLFLGGMYLIFDDMRRRWRYKKILRVLNSPTVDSLLANELCEKVFASRDAETAPGRHTAVNGNIGRRAPVPTAQTSAQKR